MVRCKANSKPSNPRCDDWRQLWPWLTRRRQRLPVHAEGKGIADTTLARVLAAAPLARSLSIECSTGYIRDPSWRPATDALVRLPMPHRGEIWYLETEDLPTSSNPRVEWFDRRNVSKLADSFADFMDSLRPLDAAAGASTSR